MRRLVTRLPAILTYDLDNAIVAKYNFLEKKLNLSSFEVLRFPAYFQYDLETRIWPRTTFVKALGIRVDFVGLNNILAPRDDEFCERTVQVPLEQYRGFVERLPPATGISSMKDSHSLPRRRWRKQPLAKIPTVDGRLQDEE